MAVLEEKMKPIDGGDGVNASNSGGEKKENYEDPD